MICLNESYSTTRLLTNEKPNIENSPDNKFDSVLFLPKGEDRKGEGGLRIKGYFKKSFEDKPLISIITVVFNGEKYLEETILSVINQSYDNIEYIIIDGGSTDGTIEIIKKYEDKINYWVSEKDKGIYDAMNKGILLTNQDSYLMWINAGDGLINLNKFIEVYNKSIDAYFFSVIQQDTQRVWLIKDLNQLNEKNLVFAGIHHQGFIVKKISIKYLYSLDVGELADLLFMGYFINNKQKSILFKKNIYIANYILGGISDYGGIKRIKSYLFISKIMDLSFFKVLMFNLFSLTKILLKPLKKVF